jgi:hypothetical protein
MVDMILTLYGGNITLQGKVVTPGTTSFVVTPDEEYYGLS